MFPVPGVQSLPELPVSRTVHIDTCCWIDTLEESERTPSVGASAAPATLVGLRRGVMGVALPPLPVSSAAAPPTLGFTARLKQLWIDKLFKRHIAIGKCYGFDQNNQKCQRLLTLRISIGKRFRS